MGHKACRDPLFMENAQQSSFVHDMFGISQLSIRKHLRSSILWTLHGFQNFNLQGGFDWAAVSHS